MRAWKFMHNPFLIKKGKSGKVSISPLSSDAFSLLASADADKGNRSKSTYSKKERGRGINEKSSFYIVLSLLALQTGMASPAGLKSIRVISKMRRL